MSPSCHQARASSQVERMPKLREGVLCWGQGCAALLYRVTSAQTKLPHPALGQGIYSTLCVCCLRSFPSSARCPGPSLASARLRRFCLLQKQCQRDSLIPFSCDSCFHAPKQVVACNCSFSARLLQFCKKDTPSFVISSYWVACGRRRFCFSGFWSSPDH